MTQAARTVLRDAEYAFALLEEAEPGQDLRVKWVAAVALLRAVGHVLHKVDGKRSERLREAIDELWGRLKKRGKRDRIFWGFIDRERNLVLKQYEHNYESGPISVLHEDREYNLEAGLFVPALEGFGEGEDIRDTFAEALSWWRTQLTIIDDTAEEQRANV